MPRRKFTTCPKCGHWNEQPHGPACAGCKHEFAKLSPTTTNGAWGNRGGVSLRYAFDPEARADLAKTAPATAEAIRDDGSFVYTSNSQQKRVFKEFAEAKERAAEEKSRRLERNDARFLNLAQQ